MTGPLAQQFAQVREGMGLMKSMVTSGEPWDRHSMDKAADALAALSAIERHVQDMEWAIGRVLSEAPYLDGPEREVLRAALPASGEKEEE